MTGHTPTGLPYPDPTDAVADTWKALQALASAINTQQLAVSGAAWYIPSANMNSGGYSPVNLPNLPIPAGGAAVTTAPLNPATARFSLQAACEGGPLRVVPYSMATSYLGKPVNQPAQSQLPFCAVGWAVAPPVPAPADGTGLVRDDWQRIQAQADALASRGMPARALLLQGTPNSSGQFAVTFPDLLVSAAVVLSATNNTSQMYNLLSGLGTDTLTFQQYFTSTLMLVTSGTYRWCVIAVGTVKPPTKETP